MDAFKKRITTSKLKYLENRDTVVGENTEREIVYDFSKFFKALFGKAIFFHSIVDMQSDREGKKNGPGFTTVRVNNSEEVQ